MYQFKKAKTSEITEIWNILQQAIIRRKMEGSNQWQDGYPNIKVIQDDIQNGAGFVMKKDAVIIGYCALFINDEPAYNEIKGKWLTTDDAIIVHRVAISEQYIGKGLAQILFKLIEEFAVNINIYSIKADTNYDNFAMLRIFEKLGYVYCGQVYLRGNPRKAYEKVLKKT